MSHVVSCCTPHAVPAELVVHDDQTLRTFAPDIVSYLHTTG
ncbi:hypothetical protein [Nonomuraea monospora]